MNDAQFREFMKSPFGRLHKVWNTCGQYCSAHTEQEEAGDSVCKMMREHQNEIRNFLMESLQSNGVDKGTAGLMSFAFLLRQS